MKVTRIVCDRCLFETDASDRRARLLELEVGVPAGDRNLLGALLTARDRRRRLDLCEGCRGEFAAWFAAHGRELPGLVEPVEQDPEPAALAAPPEGPEPAPLVMETAPGGNGPPPRRPFGD